MPKTSLIVFFLLMSAMTLKAQDSIPELTDSAMYRPLSSLNFTICDHPAYTGAEKQTTFLTAFNMDWPSRAFSNPTFGLMGDFAFGGENKRFGAGAGIEMSRPNGFFYHSYSLLVGGSLIETEKFQLRIGIKGQLQAIKLHFDELSFGDMIDPRVGFIYDSAEPLNETAYASGLNGGIHLRYQNSWLAGSWETKTTPLFKTNFEPAENQNLLNVQAGHTFNLRSLLLSPQVKTTYDGNFINIEGSISALIDRSYLVQVGMNQQATVQFAVGWYKAKFLRVNAFVYMPLDPQLARLGLTRSAGIVLRYQLQGK